MVQYVFDQLRNHPSFDRHSVITGFKLGFVVGIGTNECDIDKDQLEKIPDILFKIIEEFVEVKLNDEPELTEKELDGLLLTLQNELEKKIDHVEELIGPLENKNDVDLDKELDAVLEEISREAVMDAEIDVADQEARDMQHVHVNAARYWGIYYHINEYLTTNFDSLIMRQDELTDEDNPWKHNEETNLELQKINAEIQLIVKKKVEEMLPDPYDRSMFRRWTHTIHDDGGTAGTDFWKLTPE